jgi:glutamine synthetase
VVAFQAQVGTDSTVDDQTRPSADTVVTNTQSIFPATTPVSDATLGLIGPDTLAPWLIDWGLDNRSAMVRIPPERGSSSRLELRLGDASANPYLAIAGLLAAAYLGIRDKIEPAAPLEGYGYDPSRSAMLPSDLGTALAQPALFGVNAFSEVLGAPFVTTFLAYKRNELERFSHWITDWEFREYAYHL